MSQEDGYQNWWDKYCLENLDEFGFGVSVQVGSIYCEAGVAPKRYIGGVWKYGPYCYELVQEVVQEYYNPNLAMYNLPI